jgi:hypothetical protein
VIPERLSPERFAAAVAERLNAVVPRGLSVRAEGTTVTLYDPSWWPASSAAEIVSDDDDRSIVQRAETAARSILNATQDVIMESTREQWPPPTGAGNAPYPDARVVGERLQMWFGDEAAPILRLEPVDLTELSHGAA